MSISLMTVCSDRPQMVEANLPTWEDQEVEKIFIAVGEWAKDRKDTERIKYVRPAPPFGLSRWNNVTFKALLDGCNSEFVLFTQSDFTFKKDLAKHLLEAWQPGFMVAPGADVGGSISNIVIPRTFLIKREDLIATKGWDSDYDVCIGEDWEFFRRCQHHAGMQVKFIKDVVTHIWHENPSNETRSKQFEDGKRLFISKWGEWNGCDNVYHNMMTNKSKKWPFRDDIL